VFALPPLLALSLLLEGPQAIGAALARADASVWAAVLWQSLGNTLFGYAAWGWLLARHPAATIVPLALLVPVFGMAASAWWLGETLPMWKLLAAALVLCGLALNLLWPTLRQRLRAL
jgi:O-acetylserine/cysteine efflux transporter